MTIVETTEVGQACRYLRQTRDRIAEATSRLSDAQWLFKPAPDRWSIGENLEHMVLVQERVLDRLQRELAQAPAPAADRDSMRIDAIVLERIPDRSVRVQGPPPVQPTGRWTSPEVFSRLFQNYSRLHTFVQTTPDLRAHLLEAPPLRVLTKGAYDTLDGYQWVLALAGHDERHLRQILEVKAAPHYPA